MITKKAKIPFTHFVAVLFPSCLMWLSFHFMKWVKLFGLGS